MQFIMKTRQDNHVINHTSVFFKEYNTKVSTPIGQWVVYDKDETGQQRDRLYKSTLR